MESNNIDLFLIYLIQFTNSMIFCVQCFLLGIFFYLLIHITFTIRQEKLHYFTNFWSWIEITMAILTLCAAAIFFHTLKVHGEARRDYLRQPSVYNSLQHAVHWSCVSRYMNAILLAFLMLVVSIYYFACLYLFRK